MQSYLTSSSPSCYRPPAGDQPIQVQILGEIDDVTHLALGTVEKVFVKAVGEILQIFENVLVGFHAVHAAKKTLCLFVLLCQSQVSRMMLHNAKQTYK